MDKVKLAREIAKRSVPKFVDIPREKRVRAGTAIRKLLESNPEIGKKQAISMRRKAMEEAKVHSDSTEHFAYGGKV